jgi:hypothetical protein
MSRSHDHKWIHHLATSSASSEPSLVFLAGEIKT